MSDEKEKNQWTLELVIKQYNDCVKYQFFYKLWERKTKSAQLTVAVCRAVVRQRAKWKICEFGVSHVVAVSHIELITARCRPFFFSVKFLNNYCGKVKIYIWNCQRNECYFFQRLHTKSFYDHLNFIVRKKYWKYFEVFNFLCWDWIFAFFLNIKTTFSKTNANKYFDTVYTYIEIENLLL